MQHDARRQKEIIEQAISSCLDNIEGMGREPDTWEKHQLANALNAVAIGWYHLAAEGVRLALVPKAEISPAVFSQKDERLDRLDLVALRRALDYVRNQAPFDFWQKI